MIKYSQFIPRLDVAIEAGPRYQKENRKIRYDERMYHRWVTPWEGTTPSNLFPVASITEVYDWLISLNLLWLNMWARIYPTGQAWSTCSRVYATSWWSRGQYKYTAILRGREIQYGKLTLFVSVYFTGYASNRSRFNSSGWESTHIGTTSLNICTSSSQYIYGDTSGYSWLHQYPGSGFGGQWLWHPRVRSLLGIYRYQRVLPAKIQDPCEPRWGILWRQEDKFSSSTGLVDDRCNTAG